MASVSGVLASGASASLISITCIKGGACVGSGAGQGFLAETVAGGGLLEGALCLGSTSDACSKVHGELIFGPGLIQGSGGLGTTTASLAIVPKLVSLSAGGSTVELTASNGAIGLVALPKLGALCVHLNKFSITATPCS